MGNQWVDFYNSAVLIGTNPLQVYHKSKLVVGIETLPYKQIIEPLFGNIMLDLGGTVRSRALILIEKYFNSKMAVKWDPSSVMNLYMGVLLEVMCAMVQSSWLS